MGDCGSLDFAGLDLLHEQGHVILTLLPKDEGQKGQRGWVWPATVPFQRFACVLDHPHCQVPAALHFRFEKVHIIPVPSVRNDVVTPHGHVAIVLVAQTLQEHSVRRLLMKALSCNNLRQIT